MKTETVKIRTDTTDIRQNVRKTTASSKNQSVKIAVTRTRIRHICPVEQILSRNC